ncbi:Peroxidase [Rhynchospora pubera]|uniref:Peroxidase n=1 Tax=Rhynchospora pubera TaxID=906938 RepID=A0AAV8DWM8_9POAL|nr:Peroxidase [Rhynchospora pubera]
MVKRASIITVLVLSLISSCYGQVTVGYYNNKCGTKDVESIIRGVVQARFSYEAAIVAFLLRLQFHDCLGDKQCDASLLLAGLGSEQTAVPNFTVKGYDLIDAIEAALEQECPGVVSCSDIIAAATRDAVVLAGGSYYDVPMGRKDGLVGLASNVDLPPPDISVANAIQYYGKVGFSALETVVLLGGHTVGVTHCSVIKDRLYNYKGTQSADPDLDAFYVFFLGNIICHNDPNAVDMFVFLDSPDSVLTVDNSYYKMLLAHKGILPIDNAIAFDPSTSGYVNDLANNNDYFLDLFGKTIVKMGLIGVLTGNQGEIRQVCSRTN